MIFSVGVLQVSSSLGLPSVFKKDSVRDCPLSEEVFIYM